MKVYRHFACISGFVIAFASAAGAIVPIVDDSNSTAEAKKVRFDYQVRDDLFAGFQGDDEALTRGMKKCEEVLAIDPKHAEALVWLGSGQVYLSGKNFSKGNAIEGMKNWQVGIKNMDMAAELEPENIGVLIPRAAVLMPASRGLPAAIGKPVLESVLKSFDRVYSIQKDSLDKIGEHPLGELRMGLADVNRRLGKLDESRVHLQSLTKELPNTEYAVEAQKWLDAKPTEKLAHNCIGCHTK